jgi:poly-gamma-glutamate synthesis protein (capsule biosynthesis protein)
VGPLVFLVVLSQSPGRVTIAFGGDVIPHDPVKTVARVHNVVADGGFSLNNEGWDHVFGPLAPVFARNDFSVVNLEAPIVTVKKPERGEMVFHGPPAMLAALKKVGVSVASFANNHCLDQHREGITATRAFLREAGLLGVGCDVNEEKAWTPLVLEKHGLRIGILSVARFINGFNNTKNSNEPHVPAVGYPKEPKIIGGHSIEQLLETVRARSAEVDALVVFIHWGDEYKVTPRAEDRVLAQQMLDAGATAIVGHHPHVVQPVEWLTRADGTKGLVAFSLGNLVSNQDFDNDAGLKRDGLLLELEFSRPQPDGPVQVTKVGGVPLFTENCLARGGKKRNVQPLLLEDELAAMQARLAELEGRADKAAKDERKALTRRLSTALARLGRIRAALAAALPDAAPAAALATPEK